MICYLYKLTDQDVYGTAVGLGELVVDQLPSIVELVQVADDGQLGRPSSHSVVPSQLGRALWPSGHSQSSRLSLE